MFFAVKPILLTLSLLTAPVVTDASSTIIVGTDDRVIVNENRTNIPEFYHGVTDAIGFIEKGCTVAHIGQNLVLTAGHCIKNGREFHKIENVDCSNRPELNAEFGYFGAHEKTIKARCLKIVVAEYQASSTDYALLEVSDAPLRKLELDFKRPVEHTELTFFSHPHREPLSWSGYCSVEEFSDEEAQKLGVNFRKKTYFKHFCDSDQGSSGAPLIDAQTKKIIGIHSGGQINIDANFALFLDATDLEKTLKQYRSGD